MTDMETAGALYEAFEARDAKRLYALLDDEFHGEVTPGLPRNWGGTYDGASTMMRECWGQVFAALDTRPIPDELIETVDGRVVAIGTYRGSARETGREHEAVFAHILSFRDGKVAALTQITDSRRWHDALG